MRNATSGGGQGKEEETRGEGDYGVGDRGQRKTSNTTQSCSTPKRSPDMSVDRAGKEQDLSKKQINNAAINEFLVILT